MKRLAATLCVLCVTFPAWSAEVNPGDIKTGYPQQFISYFLTPTTSVSEIEDFRYSIKVNTNKSVENVYYHLAQWFSNYGLYYSGIQPHADGTVAFRFSSFTQGSTTTSPNCSAGADGGAGVTCGIDGLPYTPGGIYTFEIRRTASTGTSKTYVGTVTDETAGTTREIGAWTVPADAGSLTQTTAGTVELYNNSKWSITSCADIPLVDVDYSNVLYNQSIYSQLYLFNRPQQGAAGSVYACAGVPRAQSGKYTATRTGYTITNLPELKLGTAYTLTSVQSGLVLAVPGNATQAATPLTQESPDGSTGQQWLLSASAVAGEYRLQAVHSNQCVDVANGYTSAGNPIIQYPCTGGANESMTLAPDVNGAYVIRFHHSGLCADVTNGSFAAGAPIEQYTCTSGKNQAWIFKLVGAAS